MNKCKCQLNECLICTNASLIKGLCSECNYNYYPKENDPLNIGQYIKCYKDPEGYYLDYKINKQCYFTCKTCVKSGNYAVHNCIECNNNYSFNIQHDNHFNCYEN